jgi:hypothetical protein
VVQYLCKDARPSKSNLEVRASVVHEVVRVLSKAGLLNAYESGWIAEIQALLWKEEEHNWH